MQALRSSPEDGFGSQFGDSESRRASPAAALGALSPHPSGGGHASPAASLVLPSPVLRASASQQTPQAQTPTIGTGALAGGPLAPP